MSRILGLDYGRKKIGIAVAEGSLAEPLIVVKFRSEVEALKKVGQVVQAEQIEQVIAGVSEGEMAVQTREFGKKLEEKLGIPVIFQDETLTTQEAQELAIKAGIKRKKRKKLEDAYSATLILQSYLDSPTAG
jgi:putative Holliday junction resolvase